MAAKRPLCNYAGVITEKSDSDSIAGLVIGTDVQAYDGDLAAIAAISATSGLLKKTAANTWSLDTTAYGTGTVTAVSVAAANGFAGSVANASTTPAITIETSITGILKGNGTAISAASAGSDYAPATSGSAILKGNGAGGFSSAAAGTDYLAPAAIGSTAQAWDADLDAIAALAGTSGYLKKTAANTWTLDTTGVVERQYTWVISSLAVGGVLGPRLKSAKTCVRLDSHVSAATSATFNVEERTAPGTAGTNIVASDQVATTSGANTTSFSNADLAADSWLYVDISAVSGTPGQLSITLTVTDA